MNTKSGEKRVRILLSIAVGLVAIAFALIFFQFPDNTHAVFVFGEPDSEGYVEVKGYTGNAKTLKIPSTDGKGHEVRYIGELAFGGSYSIMEKVVIPNTVVEIKKSAFAGASELEEVVLSKNLVTIGRGAFSGCTELEDIEFPETLRLIDDEAFYRCINLERLYIPASVTGIGRDAFLSCENLILDVTDNQIAADVALEYNIETGTIDTTTIYLIVILAISIVLMAAIVWIWHHVRHKMKLKQAAKEEQGLDEKTPADEGNAKTE